MDITNVLSQGILIGYCPVSAIEFGTKIEIPGFVNRETFNPLDILQEGKTVITIAKVIEPKDDMYRKGIIVSSYPAYGGVFEESEKLAKYLKTNGYKAILARRLDQKDAAIKCGLGVRSKLSLIVNEQYGTNLRFDTIVTDWVPKQYSKPLTQDLCANCNACANACPYGCLSGGNLDRIACYKYYIPNKNKLGLTPICRLCQDTCKYNKKG